MPMHEVALLGGHALLSSAPVLNGISPCEADCISLLKLIVADDGDVETINLDVLGITFRFG